MLNEVVKGFELEHFLGTWYEIARIDYKFEHNLYAVTTDYTLRRDGKVKVATHGHRGGPDGHRKMWNGKAKLGCPRRPDKPGYLLVSYFWFFYQPYYILALDQHYKYALIGGRKKKYLWILSRHPELSMDIVRDLLNRASLLGYDMTRLKFVK